MEKTKKSYIPPQAELMEARVERGFAGSFTAATSSARGEGPQPSNRMLSGGNHDAGNFLFY